MASLNCPLCSAPLNSASLESHLRYELNLPKSKCRLCPQFFCDQQSAMEHFDGPLADHPGKQRRSLADAIY